MNKLIWIASYPKSGNTWMRYLLGNYYFNNSKKFDPNIITNLRKFQLNNDFINSSSVVEELKINPLNISKYWVRSQEEMKITKGNVAFLKTHNALVNINGNELTNSKLSIAIIYIVRDPRDVVISYSRFRDLSIDQTIDHMISKNLVYVHQKNKPWDVEILGSWSFNYNSWKNGIPDIPRIIIKYEDLIDDCYSTFRKVILFLSNHMNSEVDESKIKLSVELSDFKNLKKYEDKENFKENTGSEKFFRYGKYNIWKEILDKNQLKLLETNLFKEMVDLKYLNN